MKLSIDRELVKLAIEEGFRAEIIKNFDVGGRYADEDTEKALRISKFGGGTKKWKPSKRVLKKGGKTLVDKEVLRNSVYVRVEPKSDTEYVVVFGANVPYAGVHQFGYEKRNIPARPYLTVPDEALDDIIEALTDYFALEGEEKIDLNVK